jgi:hypothetical protein
VTDLDIQTWKRAQGLLSAMVEENGLWILDDPTEDELKKVFLECGSSDGGSTSDGNINTTNNNNNSNTPFSAVPS